MLRRGECVNVLPGILKKVYLLRKALSLLRQCLSKKTEINCDQLLLHDTNSVQTIKSQISNSVLKSAEKNEFLRQPPT